MIAWILGPVALGADLTLVGSASWPETTSGLKEGGAAWADLDGDGDWDLVAPAADGARLLFAVDAAALDFDDETAARAPGLAGTSADTPTRALLVGDLDHDGAPDLVRLQASRLDVWRNDGTGDLSLHWTLEAGDAVGAALTDWDADGDLDVVVVDAAGPNRIVLGDGAGGLSPSELDALPVAAGDFVTVVDLDFDDLPDLVVRAEGDAVDVWRHLASGALDPVPSLAISSAAGAGSVAACDLDGDLQYEIVATEGAGLTSAAWDGTPGLGYSPLAAPALAEDLGVEAAACADLGNDGQLDLVVADGGVDVVYERNPGGIWQSQTFDDDVLRTLAVAPADADGDGDLDLHLTLIGTNRLFVNGGPDRDNHLQLRILAAVGACGSPGGRVLRDDLGATAYVVDGATGLQIVGGLREVSGGQGRGATGWPVLHWGLPPADAVEVRVDPRYGGATEYGVAVVPADLPGAVHRLEVATDDRDGDGLLDVDEPGDADGDGHPDAEDLDADGDGLSDRDEAGRADPCAPPVDSDGDGAADAHDEDSDDDRLSDADEVDAGTEPTIADTDGGGRSDYEELAVDRTDPLDASDDLVDADGDGLPGESDGGPVDPDDADADVDDDGVSDGDELLFEGTDPLRPDTDGDGVLDGTELGVAAPGPGTGPTFVADADPSTTTDPTAEDTDGDTLADGAEDADRDGAHTPPESDPTRADTDGGGVDDGVERAAGTDPNDPSDDADAGAPGAPGRAGDRTPTSEPGIAGCGCTLGPRPPGAALALGLAWFARRRRRIRAPGGA